MLPTFLFAASALCVGIQAEQLLPRQSAAATPDPDPVLVPNASGPPHTATTTFTVTAVITSIATETNFITSLATVVDTVINNVTVELTETETEVDIQTDFVTNILTNFVTDVETEVITNIKTLPAVTEVSTEKVTLPAVTLTIAKPAITVTKTAIKTVVETATPPQASLCPGGNEEVFEAQRGVYVIVCGQTKRSFDLIPGGQTTDSVYACADLCDGLTAAGVQCSAGVFEPDTSTCFPQGAGASSSMASTQGFDTAVLNSTLAARSLSESRMKRSWWTS